MLQWVENIHEKFDIVDKEDNVIQIGVAEDQIHLNNDITRVATVYVFDHAGKFYIAQRSPNKIVDPLKYEAPSHGRVNSGESYEHAIIRETEEELWVTLVKYEEIDHFYFSFDSNVGKRQHYKKLFIGYIEDNIHFDPVEIHTMKVFNNIQDFFDFYENNWDVFSNACAFDVPRLKSHFT